MTSRARTILRIWAGLVLLLAATTAVAFVPLGSANLVISLAIAAGKAVLVMLFFMEVKGSRGLVRAFAAAGFFWLLILFTLTLADYTHRKDSPAPLDRPVPINMG